MSVSLEEMQKEIDVLNKRISTIARTYLFAVIGIIVLIRSTFFRCRGRFKKIGNYFNNSFNNCHSSSFCVRMAKKLAIMAIMESIVGIQK